LLPPDPAAVAAMPYYAMHPLGVERRRAEVLRTVCGRASRIEGLSEDPTQEARAWLELLPGVGPWTAAQVAQIALGDADAVSVGDFHMPHMVCWALAREPRGTDERMLELLEPYRGHRARVQHLLLASGAKAPRFGPRLEPAAIERY
jgi:3-methyladenine DNA glycosylase/8-oxoguanine DNA glycosylase